MTTGELGLLTLSKTARSEGAIRSHWSSVTGSAIMSKPMSLQNPSLRLAATSAPDLALQAATASSAISEPEGNVSEEANALPVSRSNHGYRGATASSITRSITGPKRSEEHTSELQSPYVISY